jgi:hypothetical protein
MRENGKLISKEEKDGIVTSVTRIGGARFDWLYEYHDRINGISGFIVEDEDGEIVDGAGLLYNQLPSYYVG